MSSNTSLDGLDFSDITVDLTIEPGVDKILVNIPILNDSILEDQECFSVDITSADPGVQTGGPATVCIIDPYGKLVVLTLMN